MKHTSISLLTLTLFFLLFVNNIVQSQKGPDCIKTAKISRPTWLYINSKKLGEFYKNFGGGVDFKGMKIVKSELSYYLIADEASGTRIFAFELEQKGKKLFLNKYLPIQSCSEGELSLDTFLQEDGKITGCRIGNHTIAQKQKG